MTPTTFNRRHFVRSSGLGALAFQVAGATAWLTPREARAADVPLTRLSPDAARLLGAFADHILPGAAAAGVVQFVDQQLGVEPNECLLMCKYFPEIKPPFTAFYNAGLEALGTLVERAHGGPFTALDDAARSAVVEALWRGEVDPWTGPPPPLFYMMVRSDAVDVVYGTKEGFDTLNVPYMAHIMPPEKW